MSVGFGEMPHWSPLIVHLKFFADLSPLFQPGNGALHISLTLRLEATPVHSLFEVNVKTEDVPSGVRYGGVRFNTDVSISQMLPTNCSES